MFKIQWSFEFFNKNPVSTELRSILAQNILSWWRFIYTIKETRTNGKLKTHVTMQVVSLKNISQPRPIKHDISTRPAKIILK